MFGLSFVELAIVAVLALLLLGPDQLPGMAKTLGKGLRELRRATDDLKGTFETEMSKLEREVEQAQRDPPPPPIASAPLSSAPAADGAGGDVPLGQLPASWSGVADVFKPGAAAGAPVALDQLHHAAPDPAALRARARAMAIPKDPGAARSAARFAAHARVVGAAEAAGTPAPVLGPPPVAEVTAPAAPAEAPSALGTDAAAPNGYTAVSGPGFTPAVEAEEPAAGPVPREKKPGAA